MGSITDLTPEGGRELLELEEIVKSRLNFCTQFHRAALVDMLRIHGIEKMRFIIQKCMANDWLKPDCWDSLGELVATHGIDKVRWAIKRLNGRENHSIDMVEKIVLTPALAYHEKPGKEPEPVRKPLAPIYPTQDFIYDGRAAQKWLWDNHSLGFEHWPEYFERCGVDDYGHQLVQLKSEYR